MPCKQRQGQAKQRNSSCFQDRTVRNGKILAWMPWPNPQHGCGLPLGCKTATPPTIRTLQGCEVASGVSCVPPTHPLMSGTGDEVWNSRKSRLDVMSARELFQAGRNWLLGWGNNCLDLRYARTYLERAAKLGHEEAMWMLKLTENSSASLPKDDDERCVWLLGLFTDESLRAMFYRAWYIQDRSEASSLLRKAMVEVPTAAARLGP